MVERIKKIVDEKEQGNYTSFSKRIGMKQNTLSQQMTGKRGLSIDVIVGIANGYPEINLDWLITGSGGMVRKEINPHVTLVDSNFMLDRFEKLIRENEQLRAENELLKNKGERNVSAKPYSPIDAPLSVAAESGNIKK